MFLLACAIQNDLTRTDPQIASGHIYILHLFRPFGLISRDTHRETAEIYVSPLACRNQTASRRREPTRERTT